MKTLFVCLFVMCTGLAAQAADVEVTDFNSLKAACQAVQAGDTITLRGGTGAYADYVFPRGQHIGCVKGTSWEIPVTLRLFPGEKVRFVRGDASTGSGNASLRFGAIGVRSNPRYTVLIGADMPETPDPSDRALVFDDMGISGNGDEVMLVDVEIKNCSCTSALGDGNYWYMFNLSVHHNGSGGLSHGIYSHGSFNMIVGGWWSYNTGWSLHFYNAKNHDPDPAKRCIPGVVTAENPKGCGVIGNILDGVVLEKSGAIFYPGWDNVVHNSVFRMAPDGTQADLRVNGLRNLVAHNVFDRSEARINAGCDDCVAYNNLRIAIQPTAPMFVIDPAAANFVESHNLKVVIGTDPMPVVDYLAGDYHPLPGSALIDAGLTLTQVDEDADGVSRPQGLSSDIGAFELIVDPPAAPVQNPIVLLCGKRLQLSWNAVEGATGYNVYVKKRSAATYRPAVDVGNVLSAVYDTNLDVGGTYDAYVTAYNTAGEGAASNLKTKTAYDNPCP
jgi:hypothetical protein